MLTIEEFEILVPWGHISVKAWGDKSNIPMLVLHGIQDNCTSFDRLIPLLPTSFYYLCIDLPGHGKSSHFCRGLPLHFLDYVYSIKLVVENVKWRKFYAMGHSLGARIILYFSSLYPELIEKAILIDGFTPEPVPENRTAAFLRKVFDSHFDSQKRLASNKPPSYTFEEAIKRMQNQRGTNISYDQVKVLIERGLVGSGKGYMFSADQRLKQKLPTTYTMFQLTNIVANVKCPCLLLLAEDTFTSAGSHKENFYHERLNTIFKPLLNFEIAIVKGNHDVHLIDPERVSTLVIPFILKPNKSHL